MNLDEHEYGVGVVDRLIVKMVRWQALPVLGGAVKLLLKWRGTDIPVETLTDGDPVIMHGASAVAIHPTVRLGRKVVIMHGVTLGRADTWERARGTSEPGIVVGDHAFLGAGCAVLYKDGQTITVGERSVIGANSVVTTDVPPGEVWAGNPARRLRAR